MASAKDSQSSPVMNLQLIYSIHPHIVYASFFFLFSNHVFVSSARVTNSDTYSWQYKR